ncbi:MAG: hypothetical protein DLM70_12490 [Chloroflexi bacterium]|nr:MAG: hypothetical protein DLM70_12490 [Chloroflexota bacterium]
MTSPSKDKLERLPAVPEQQFEESVGPEQAQLSTNRHNGKNEDRVTSTDDTLYDKRADIVRVAQRHGASSVRVFGSVARGEAGPRSDVDLLVELEPGRTLLDQAALQIELEELLGRHVDVVTERSLKPRIRERVLRDAHSL